MSVAPLSVPNCPPWDSCNNAQVVNSKWLRGRDLNPRPLGYERPGAQVSNRLYGTYGDPEVQKSTLWTPFWESVGSAFFWGIFDGVVAST
jgi:hypothetical protein